MIAAAFCPPAPLLIPGLAPRLAGSLGDLVGAVRRAVRAVASVDRILVVSAGGLEIAYPPGTPISAAPFARHDLPVVAPRALPGDALDDASHGPTRAGTAAPVSAAPGTVVAAHLLTAADVTAPTTAVELPVALPGAAAIDLAGRLTAQLTALQDEGASVGLLVMAAGAAAHGIDAPAGNDPRAAPFDEELSGVLASGDPVRLAETCARLGPLAAALRCDELPILAAVAAVAPPGARAELLHYSAPLGIGYPVAAWTWPGNEPAHGWPS